MASDVNALADMIDDYRATLRAMVAGVMQDGFTEEQARQIVTNSFQPPSKKRKRWWKR